MIDPAANPLAFFVSEMIRCRTVAGLSQPALAKRLSYSASQVAKIETCQRVPKLALAGKLDEVFATDGLFARLQPLVERSSVLPAVMRPQNMRSHSTICGAVHSPMTSQRH
jgi:transcriptional regulator with XRE-family HTH domain